jgi:hypothetical protein
MKNIYGTIVVAAMAVLAAAANGAEPVSAVGKVSIPSKDRTWKIVYGTSEGPEGRALELLRPRRVYVACPALREGRRRGCPTDAECDTARHG